MGDSAEQAYPPRPPGERPPPPRWLVVPMFVLFAAFLGIGTYTWQKEKDRNTALRELKQQEYVVFLDDLIAHVYQSDDPALAVKYNQSRQRLNVIASEEVILAVKDVDRFLAWPLPEGKKTRSAEQMKELRDLLSELYKAMRVDSFESTILPNQLLLDWAVEIPPDEQ